MAELIVREMCGPDLTAGFIETLSSLYRIDDDLESVRRVFRERLKYARTYVAEADGKIVGTATLVMETKYGHHFRPAGRIEDVAVHPDARRSGIGLALVKHAVEQARVLKCYKVVLECTAGLIGFYAKAGFRCHEQGMRIDLEK